jgi:hypothetical protein
MKLLRLAVLPALLALALPAEAQSPRPLRPGPRVRHPLRERHRLRRPLLHDRPRVRPEARRLRVEGGSRRAYADGRPVRLATAPKVDGAVCSSRRPPSPSSAAGSGQRPRACASPAAGGWGGPRLLQPGDLPLPALTRRGSGPGVMLSSAGAHPAPLGHSRETPRRSQPCSRTRPGCATTGCASSVTRWATARAGRGAQADRRARRASGVKGNHDAWLLMIAAGTTPPASGSSARPCAAA